MDTLTCVVLTVSALTFPLYFCIPTAQRTRYFNPASRVLFLLNNVGFAACIVQVVRRMIGYEWATLDHALLLIPITALTIHNVSMFVCIRCSPRTGRGTRTVQ